MSIFLILSIIFIPTAVTLFFLYVRNHKRINQLKQNLSSKLDIISDYEEKLLREKKELNYVKNNLLEVREEIKYYDYYLRQYEDDIYKLTLTIQSLSKWVNFIYQDNDIEETERILNQKMEATEKIYKNIQELNNSLEFNEDVINESDKDSNEDNNNEHGDNEQKTALSLDINNILEKINKGGMNTLSQDELDFLKKYNK